MGLQVDEYMGATEVPVSNYSKAVRLLTFLLVEAPSLVLNPLFSLKSSDRNRIQNYIEVLNKRQHISESRIMAVFKSVDQPSPTWKPAQSKYEWQQYLFLSVASSIWMKKIVCKYSYLTQRMLKVLNFLISGSAFD